MALLAGEKWMRRIVAAVALIVLLAGCGAEKPCWVNSNPVGEAASFVPADRTDPPCPPP